MSDTMSCKRLLLLMVAAVLLWPGAGTRADEVRLLGGKTVTGSVTNIGATEIEIKTGDGMVKVPLTKVLELQLRAAKGAGGGKQSEVRLVDESVLRATKVVFREKTLELTLTSGQTIEVPFEAVTAVLHDVDNPDLKKQWEKILKTKVREDRVVLLDEGSLEAIAGVFGEILVKEEKIRFTPSGGKDKVEMPLSRPRGFLFLRTELPKGEPICRVLDVAGNAVTALKVGYDGKEYAVTTMFGNKLAFKPELVAKLDFNFGKLTFLSDLEPAKVVEKLDGDPLAHYRRDTNLYGEKIVLQSEPPPSSPPRDTPRKGISMHAYTELEYELGGKYKEFKALAGVAADSEAAGDQSQAVLKIYCDGTLQLEATITPKEVRQIAFNVKDVQTLRIVVSSKDRPGAPDFLRLHDHVTLAEARVSQ